MLAWNDDATAISAKFALESTELLVDAMERRDGITVLGTPIDLAKVDCDSFHVAGYTDHITPWRAAYTSTQVLGGDKELAVVKSGHIQSFVNPAAKSRYDYWEGPPASDDPDRWLAGATEHHGSWWPQWLEWLTARSGPEKAATQRARQPEVPVARAGSRHLRAPIGRRRRAHRRVGRAGHRGRLRAGPGGRHTASRGRREARAG